MKSRPEIFVCVCVCDGTIHALFILFLLVFFLFLFLLNEKFQLVVLTLAISL